MSSSPTSSYAHNRGLGAFGENVAADHLRSLGMVVIDRNWRCRHGEIDIVARDGDTFVVCEVKTRTTKRWGAPIEAVNPAKAQRLRRLAGQWLQVHGLRPPSIRIDVVSVFVPHDGDPVVERIAGVA